MMFPKQPTKKKRLKHCESILHKKDGTCYLCMMLHDEYRIHKGLHEHKHRTLHEHHIFGGPTRIHSEEEGLKVYLCPEHHEHGPEAAHKNADVADILHRIGQQAFEREYPNLEFREIFGKNYL